MEKPCGEECADEDSVFHNGVAQPERFGVLEHPLQGFDDIRRVKLLKAVVDVALAAILGALHIVLHPLLQCLDAVGVPSAGDACDAVPVHAPHNVRDHRLHNSVVNILVRPQKRLVDVSPFAFTAVRVAIPAPSLEGRVHVLVSVDQTLDECSELLHIFIHIIFDLNDLFVQAVIAVSPMAGVHFLNCQTKVFVRYDLFVNSNSFHQGCFSSL